jgi:hypothetical protein
VRAHFRDALRYDSGWRQGSLAIQPASVESIAQHLFDAGIEALAGCTDAVNHIARQAKRDMHLRALDRRPAHSLPCFVLLGENLLERARPGELFGGRPGTSTVALKWARDLDQRFPATFESN